MMRKWLILGIGLMGVGNLVALTQYVTKTATPLLRSDASLDSQVVGALSARESVEVLKTDLQNGFSYVETANHQSGWVPTSQLLSADDRVTEDQEPSAQPFWQRVHDRVQALTQSVRKTNLAAQVESFKPHEEWVWFLLGASAALIGVFLRRLMGSGGKKRRKKSLSLFM